MLGIHEPHPIQIRKHWLGGNKRPAKIWLKTVFETLFFMASIASTAFM